MASQVSIVSSFFFLCSSDYDFHGARLKARFSGVYLAVGIRKSHQSRMPIVLVRMEDGRGKIIISGASFSIHYRKITPTILLRRSSIREMPAKVLASFVGFSSLGFNSRVSSPSFFNLAKKKNEPKYA